MEENDVISSQPKELNEDQGQQDPSEEQANDADQHDSQPTAKFGNSDSVPKK